MFGMLKFPLESFISLHYRLRAIRGVPFHDITNYLSVKGRDELFDICPLSTAQIFAIKYL